MDAILQSRAEQLATEFANQHHTVEDLNGLMGLMMKTALERMLSTELDVHLGRKAPPAALQANSGDAAPSSGEPPAAVTRASKPNRRNGHSRKTVQGDLGELTLSTPRDRDGTFEPLLIPKHQRRLPGFDEKILARRRVADYVEHYNHVRLNSAIGYLTPADKPNGPAQLIFDERDRKLEQARQRRPQARQAVREVA